MYTLVIENVKYNNLLEQNIQKIWDTMKNMKRPNLRMIGMEEAEETQLKDLENIFYKIIEENNLKNEIPVMVQEVFRTQNRLDQKIRSPSDKLIKTTTEIFFPA
jgi:type I restriction-modification system DNA methylase subunit